MTVASVTVASVTVAGATRSMLPPEAYFDAQWYAREQRDLFGRTWNLVAYDSDLPQPGDALAVKVGTHPTLLVRQRDSSVKAFLNSCRHRGMTLVDDTARACDRIRCPYHGWEFGLTGSLDRVPQRAAEFDDVDAAALGLIEMSVTSWMGMVFVHPEAGRAGEFADWLGDLALPEFSGLVTVDDLVEVGRFRYQVACNWKLYIENHVDVYHLWFLHEQSLGMYDHQRFEWNASGSHWASVERFRDGGARPRPTVLDRHVDPAEALSLRANLLFPNVPFTTTSTTVNTYQVIPTGPTTCELDLRVRAMPGSVVDDALVAEIKAILVDEDAMACEGVQRNVTSPWFQLGPLARTHEEPVRMFHESVLAAMR